MAEVSAEATETAPQEGAVLNGSSPDQSPPAPPAPPAIADEAVAAAERIAFLALASELARGRNVLVIDDGASALAGIAAHLDSTEIGALDTPADGAYDLVVADLIVADDGAAFGVPQLARIVGAEAGVALLRVPNRPEFAPLLDAFTATFARTLTLRQHNWVASALLDDAMFANDDPSRAVAASVRKMAAAQPGDELYQVVIGAHGAFPDFRPQLAMTRSVVLREMIAELQITRERAEAELVDAKAENVDQAARIRELEEELAWYDEHNLAVRATVEAKPWAMNLLSLWSSIVSITSRARNVLRG
ncbi:MAG: hypothetical protein JHC98_00630 [Thermoleophilaceae bacterium]|nr:hypothetical protein [Thermoleophilaceae bacterium]